MRLRTLSAVAVATLAVAGLSGCRTNVGAAAVIDGHRISESDVGKYVTAAGPTAKGLAQAKEGGQQLLPKSVALNALVQERVYRIALDRGGSVPAPGELAALHDHAAATLLGTTLTGDELDARIAAELKDEGLSPRFLPLLLRQLELKYALIERTQATSEAELAKAVNAHPIDVSVNPRYGKWQTDQLGVGPPGSDLPDFLKLASSSAAAPTS